MSKNKRYALVAMTLDIAILLFLFAIISVNYRTNLLIDWQLCVITTTFLFLGALGSLMIYKRKSPRKIFWIFSLLGFAIPTIIIEIFFGGWLSVLNPFAGLAILTCCVFLSLQLPFLVWKKSKLLATVLFLGSMYIVYATFRYAFLENYCWAKADQLALIGEDAKHPEATEGGVYVAKCKSEFSFIRELRKI